MKTKKGNKVFGYKIYPDSHNINEYRVIDILENGNLIVVKADNAFSEEEKEESSVFLSAEEAKIAMYESLISKCECELEDYQKEIEKIKLKQRLNDFVK